MIFGKLTISHRFKRESIMNWSLLHYESIIPLLGIYPRIMKTYVYKRLVQEYL